MIEEIKKIDKSFNETTFISKVDRIFMMVLDSIMQKDIRVVDHYANDEVCNKLSELIDDYKMKNITRLFDESNIKSTNISGFSFKDNNIYITVDLISRYMDYFIDEDGSYVSGINDHRIETLYKLTFVKNINAKELGIVTKCPSCGNSLNSNVSGLCSFCRNVIDMFEYEYILCDINIK